jgi:hypothetical protein
MFGFGGAELLLLAAIAVAIFLWRGGGRGD